MAKFTVKWGNGKTETVEQSECTTVEQFVNVRFGSQGAGKAEVTVEGQEKKPEPKKLATKK